MPSDECSSFLFCGRRLIIYGRSSGSDGDFLNRVLGPRVSRVEIFYGFQRSRVLTGLFIVLTCAIAVLQSIIFHMIKFG